MASSHQRKFNRGADYPQTARLGLTTGKAGLCLITQALLVPILLHAFTTLMFGDLGFAPFLKRAHNESADL